MSSLIKNRKIPIYPVSKHKYSLFINSKISGEGDKKKRRKGSSENQGAGII